MAIAALLPLLITGCASLQKKPPPTPYQLEPCKFGRWDGQKLTTEHYDVYTTITDPVLIKAFPGLIEGAWQQYQRMVPPAHAPQRRMPVYLLSTRSQWAEFTQRVTGPRAKVFLQIRNGGFSDNGVSIIQYVAHQVTFPLLAHEGFHQYLHHYVNPAVPAWVNEGLAVVCEGQRWTTSGLDKWDAWYNPVRENQLGESLLRDKLFPLKELLDTNAGNVIQETSVRVGTYYAQVWALSLFLMEGENGKYAASYKSLLAALGSPDLDRRLAAENAFAGAGNVSRGEALFRAFISDDLDTVEREYIRFLRQRLLHERVAAGLRTGR